MMTFLVIAVIFVISWIGTEVFRRFGLRKSLLDIPNERSSHSVPVPRGGGILIVILSLTVYVIAAIYFEKSLSAGYLIGAGLIAVVSLADDLVSVPFIIRLLIHFLAAAILIYDTASFSGLRLLGFGLDLPLGIAGPAVTLLWLVWMINSYNFMDGIDGIAGVQAMVAAAGWMFIAGYFDTDWLTMFCAAIAASVAGFLIHNWSPASIFMGDVGSAFLGFTFGSMPLLLGQDARVSSGWLFSTAIIILWPFLFDTAYTLLRRIVRREPLWKAHRSHLYQRLVISGYSHRFVSLLYGISALVLTSLAVIAISTQGKFESVMVIVTVAYVVALVIMVHTRKRLT
jgi:UDP-N-acetylmuramyl pentapeptide phosphotransferase/UDP-N-acetylglucosamine-1-phosphate transferase